jgi:hypothetical protein
MAIICDKPGCVTRTHQPVPFGWTIVWAGAKRYEHYCPAHSSPTGACKGVSGAEAAETKGKARRAPQKPRPKPAKEDPDDQGVLF